MILIDVDLAREVLPYFVYQPIHVLHAKEVFTFQVDYSYGYWLRHIRVKYPERLYPGNLLNATFSPTLNIEIYDVADGKARQSTPFKVQLISTPGKEGATQQAAAAPVDTNNFGIEFTADPAIKSVSNLNFLFRSGGAFKIEFSGQEYKSNVQLWSPEYIELFIEGYYVPRRAFNELLKSAKEV